MRLVTFAAVGSHALLPAAWAAGGGAGAAMGVAWGVAQAAITTELLRPRSQIFGRTIWRGPTSSPRVALTFDDGPTDPHALEALRILRECDVRATFFLVGERALERRDLVRAVVDAGHEVAVHSLTHPWHFSLAGPKRMRREVIDAARAIEEASGIVPRFYRPPMGHKSVFLAPLLEEAGLRMVAWTARGFDTVGSDARAVAKRLLDGVGPGSILLLHEERARRSGASPALVALPGIVAELRERGLEPVTLRELLPPP